MRHGTFTIERTYTAEYLIFQGNKLLKQAGSFEDVADAISYLRDIEKIEPEPVGVTDVVVHTLGSIQYILFVIVAFALVPESVRPLLAVAMLGAHITLVLDLLYCTFAFGNTKCFCKSVITHFISDRAEYAGKGIIDINSLTYHSIIKCALLLTGCFMTWGL